MPCCLHDRTLIVVLLGASWFLIGTNRPCNKKISGLTIRTDINVGCFYASLAATTGRIFVDRESFRKCPKLSTFVYAVTCVQTSADKTAN